MVEPLALTAAAAGITIVRVFDAPRELVWKEWTEPRRFADWFGGPEIEVPLPMVSIDLRPGGAWSATTLAYGPKRRDICWSGRYLEIVEPERLSFTITADRGALEVVTVRLSDLAGHTEMRFRQRGSLTAEEYKRAAVAWSAEFDHIGERLGARDWSDEPSRQQRTNQRRGT